MSDAVKAELMRIAHDWDRGMLQNTPDAIGEYMADDWTIIGPDGSIDGKETFLALIRSGVLTHDVMESHDMDVRVYEDTAVVIARGISGGQYQGQSFHVVERVSSVFVKQSGTWRCVSTHLSRMNDVS